jgi:hypothetical protein
LGQISGGAANARQPGGRAVADKFMIVMMNTDPRNAAELGAPFF